MLEQTLWVEKYRPRSLKDCILPAALRSQLEGLVSRDQIPHLLFSGPPGVGKTTVARSLLLDVGIKRPMFINGSLKGNIDTLRNLITEYASQVSFDGKRKFVILDEADYLNAQSTQPALRNFMEQYADNCGFILTCNYPHKIMPEIHSRCVTYDFSSLKSELMEIGGQYVNRICAILDAEKIEYDIRVVATLVKDRYPDLRRMLNELQGYSSNGKVDQGILAIQVDREMDDLFDRIRSKRLDLVSEWVLQKPSIDFPYLMRRIFDNRTAILPSARHPELVVALADYQDKDTRVVDKHVNTIAMLAEVIALL